MMRQLCLYLLVLLFVSGPAHAQEENRAFIRSSVKWPSNTIKVSWINPHPSNVRERRLVEEAIRDTWERASRLQFLWVENDANDYGIRILIDDDHPHTNGLGKSLANHDVGMVLNFDFYRWLPIRGGNRAMVLNRYDYFIRVIAIHEFGHAIGFAHEHNRGDCINCDERPQGTDGDWWTPVCDENSVMNYCNPRYNNDGELSEGDIEGVRALYGTPADSQPVAGESSVRLTHTFEKSAGTRSKAKVYLTGDFDELQQVQRVTYHFGEDFTPSTLVSTHAADHFSIEVNLTRSVNFTLYAEVEFSNGTTKTIQRYINFELPVVANPQTFNIEVNFLVEEEELDDGRSLFSLSVEPTSNIFQQIERVEYHNENFRAGKFTSDNPDNDFKVRWRSRYCRVVTVKIYFSRAGSLYVYTTDIDMCGE